MGFTHPGYGVKLRFAGESVRGRLSGARIDTPPCDRLVEFNQIPDTWDVSGFPMTRASRPARTESTRSWSRVLPASLLATWATQGPALMLLCGYPCSVSSRGSGELRSCMIHGTVRE